jgi:hypothetical protein
MPCRSHSAAGHLFLFPTLGAELAHLQRTNQKEDAMSDEIRNSEKTGSGGTTAVQRQWLSLDSWAVLLALAAAALVKLHILNSVKW